MKKLVLVLSLFAALNTGCATWRAEFRRDPVAAMLEGVNYIQTALNLAKAAFESYAIAAGNVPAATVATFNALVTDAARGLQTANDGLRLAQQVGQPDPDPAALLYQARSTMGDIASFLAGLQAPHGFSNDVLADAVSAARKAAQAPAR
jgi:hypothetical protein